MRVKEKFEKIICENSNNRQKNILINKEESDLPQNTLLMDEI